MAPGTLHSVASDSSAGQQGRGGASVAPGHPISLLVFRANDLPWPSRDLTRVGNVEASVTAERGFNVIVWRRGELGYALVSDVDAGELAALAARLTRARALVPPARDSTRLPDYGARRNAPRPCVKATGWRVAAWTLTSWTMTFGKPVSGP